MDNDIQEFILRHQEWVREYSSSFIEYNLKFLKLILFNHDDCEPNLKIKKNDVP